MLRYEAYANLAIRVTHFVSPIRGGKQNTPSITYAVPMAEPHMKPEQNVRPETGDEYQRGQNLIY